jgi:AcrR family transcriptional regulator
MPPYIPYIYTIMAQTPKTKPNPIKRSPQDRRESLLDAALALFCERGFHGTNVPQLLERANISAGAMYNQFASKEELANTLYQRCSGLLTAALWEAAPLSGSFRRQFGDLLRRLADFAAQHPNELAFAEAPHHEGYLTPESRALAQARAERLRAFFSEAQTQGVLRSTPIDVLLPLVWCGFLGLVRSSSAPLSPEALSEAERSLWEAIRA